MKRRPATSADDFIVVAAHQNRGIGTQILRELQADARARGGMQLVVLRDNRARGLYLRHGFRVIDTQPTREELAWP